MKLAHSFVSKLAFIACAQFAVISNIAEADQSALSGAIESRHRSPEYTKRDAARHPMETLSFFGVTPSMSVVEIWPGGGWYTEILAPLLNENGHFFAAHFPKDTSLTFFRNSRDSFKTKLNAEPSQYDKVTLTELSSRNISKVAPEHSADMVLTFRNVHNWISAGGDKLAFASFYNALKPGGILGVVEHRAHANTSIENMKKSGYVTENHVIFLAESAGFKLVARSEINANPKDKKNHPKGVWTLPPTFRLGDKDRQTYIAIGESDRMTLKFKKPLK